MRLEGRVLAIDVGDRYTGLALSDELGILASPWSVLDMEEVDLLEELPKIITDEGIGVLVVGLPLSLSGEDTSQTQVVRALVEKLESLLSIPIVLIDERLTSKEASSRMSGEKKKDRGQRRDAEAAAIILQHYLESLRL